MVKEEWRGLRELQFTEIMKALTGPLGRWHKDNFGEMDKKILKLEEEIKKGDGMVSNGVYDGTMEARRKALVTCCERWYVRKEIHWKQMSRSRQAKEMDRNTRYFHHIASARRRNNRIDALIVNDRLVRNQARIKIAVREFYKDLYHQGSSPLLGFRDGLVKRIDEEEYMTLEAMHSTEEIREAVWDCESSKVPGCDGYNMNFIKRCWDKIGAEFTAFVMGFFQNPSYRQILILYYLEGASYEDESSDARISRGDSECVCEGVKRSFVDIVLQKIEFGRRWRAWVMECVTTASISVLINGSPSKPFKMERGLRQGDPLFPFLFVLVVDVLHRMVGEAVRIGRIFPLVVGRDSVELSHLQFADDTILFYPPENETMKNYKWLLRWFELMSGLSINYEKSSLIPINFEELWVQHMCSLWGCKEDTLPVKYLGIPLGANPRLVKTWKPITDKVEDKLSLWKTKVLNKAGKVVLIKSVLNSLPVYYLSLYKMPKPVAKKLISLQRRFL
ncbi:uncharacterized protein LOC127743072 [Arachis duranensis]|uniref:Uncharacterized protein LOC127743072 n=1 Tax=Arachis duranensis TaxID=130453 RepID=A0A9C6TD32_ARADU|nr:uncharacterized protein LOC127743072 [Arachis duranensis]